MSDLIVDNYAYLATGILLVIGLYAVLTKRNLVKKLIGLNIVQAAIILIWVSTATKDGATVPVLDSHGHGAHEAVEAAAYMNPLPHTLMLTAIVVGVATTGVAFALLLSIFRRYDTLDEEELLEQMRSAHA